ASEPNSSISAVRVNPECHAGHSSTHHRYNSRAPSFRGPPMILFFVPASTDKLSLEHFDVFDRLGLPTQHAGGWLHASLRFAALVFPRSVAISKLTRWPSFSVESPERSTALIWTNMSGPPSCRAQ